ncbi:MAG: hypothetical protein M1170_00125 [Patescibacteria group bacterium]|nr:hypothetical protein [Patescibacteria group bacterium]
MPGYLTKIPRDLRGSIFKREGAYVSLIKSRLINFSPANPTLPFKIKIEKILTVANINNQEIQPFDYSSNIKEVNNIFEIIDSVGGSYTTKSKDCNWYGACKITYTTTYINYILTAYGRIYRGIGNQSTTIREGAFGGAFGGDANYGTNSSGLSWSLVYEPQYPSVDLKINGVDGDILSMTVPDTDVVLSWTSAEVSDCKASGDWNGDKSISGKEELGKLFRGKENPGQGRTYNFIISCRTNEGEEVSDRVSANIFQYPSCSFWADPEKIILPQISTLKWFCEYTDSANIAPEIGNVNSGDGSVDVRPSENTVFLLNAFGLDGSTIYRVAVEIGMPKSSSPLKYRIKEVTPR